MGWTSTITTVDILVWKSECPYFTSTHISWYITGAALVIRAWEHVTKILHPYHHIPLIFWDCTPKIETGLVDLRTPPRSFVSPRRFRPATRVFASFHPRAEGQSISGAWKLPWADHPKTPRVFFWSPWRLRKRPKSSILGHGTLHIFDTIEMTIWSIIINHNHSKSSHIRHVRSILQND